MKHYSIYIIRNIKVLNSYLNQKALSIIELTEVGTVKVLMGENLKYGGHAAAF